MIHFKRCFDNRSRANVPKRLLAGGPALMSPDSRKSVRLVACAKGDGIPDGSLRVVIAAGDTVLNDWYVRLGQGDSDLLWGPESSRFAIIQSTSETREYYAAYDLRTGRRLRDESWDKENHRGLRILNNALLLLKLVR